MVNRNLSKNSTFDIIRTIIQKLLLLLLFINLLRGKLIDDKEEK